VPLNEQPHVIHPHAVYTVASLQAALGLTRTTVAREVRLRRLRVSRRGGRYYLIGRWVLQWLEEGEVRRKRSDEVGEVPGA
jgi:hypothetical protein